MFWTRARGSEARRTGAPPPSPARRDPGASEGPEAPTLSKEVRRGVRDRGASSSTRMRTRGWGKEPKETHK